MTDVIARIYRYRKRLCLSQEYVAKHMGIRRNAYTMIENGKRELKADEAVKLAALFGVSVDRLLTGIGEEHFGEVEKMFSKLCRDDQEEIAMLVKLKYARQTKITAADQSFDKENKR